MGTTPLPTKQNSSAKLLSLNNVSYDIDRQRLLSHISIDIAVNETVSLIGPNGAGKSTLVKLILGLITASEGTITAHQPLQLGYVPQRFAVPPILPLRVKDLLAQADKRRLQLEQRQFIFDKLSLNPACFHGRWVIYAGGETQRVLLARALLDKPNLLILDEPMRGLILILRFGYISSLMSCRIFCAAPCLSYHMTCIG